MLFFFFFFLSRRRPRSTLFPYTTLFRSDSLISLGTLLTDGYICQCCRLRANDLTQVVSTTSTIKAPVPSLARKRQRSEEHTSELQSLRHLVCRLLLEKKKTKTQQNHKPH